MHQQSQTLLFVMLPEWNAFGVCAGAIVHMQYAHVAD